MRKFILVDDTVTISVELVEPCKYVTILEGFANQQEGATNLVAVRTKISTRVRMKARESTSNAAKPNERQRTDQGRRYDRCQVH